ncbi:MAG: hypothetical protein K2M11_05590 [Paramuribaculum sp.]|nr:hypothetical protein [Paramuribaculum sp.]
MEALTVREYRENLSTYFDRASAGEQVLIRRKNVIYALVSVGCEEVNLSPNQKHHVSEIAESISRSWKQVKQMEAGEIPVKSAMEFIDEL